MPMRNFFDAMPNSPNLIHYGAVMERKSQNIAKLLTLSHDTFKSYNWGVNIFAGVCNIKYQKCEEKIFKSCFEYHWL